MCIKAISWKKIGHKDNGVRQQYGVLRTGEIGTIPYDLLKIRTKCKTTKPDLKNMQR